MLKFLRKKNISRVIFWFLVILIMPAFVLWGTGSMSGSRDKGPKFVGMINKKKVSFEDLYAGLNAIRCQIILNYFGQPKVLDSLLANKEFLAKMAWDRIIMSREADKNKLKASDKEVINYIRSHPIFAQNGAFDDRMYEHILRYNVGLDPRAFEEIMRDNIKIKKLNDLAAKDLKVSDDEILTEYKKDSDKFKISYVLSDANNFAPKVSVDDAAVKDYYEKNKNEFVLPKKEGEKAAGTAKFDDIKEGIRSYLAEREAKNMALKNAVELRKNIANLIDREKLSFADAVSKLGLKLSETVFFGKEDYLEGLGEAKPVVEEAVIVGKGNISIPVEVRRGAIIFTVLDTQKFDEERFKKEKDDFTKIILENKKNKFLEKWLVQLEAQASLNINLKEYEKYYK